MNSYYSLIKAKQELVKSTRINPLCMIAICMLLGLLAGCPSPTGPSLGTNANLEDLTLSSGTLSPVFAASTPAYDVTVDSDVDSITMTATAAASSATIEVRLNGASWKEIPSGTPSSALNIKVGPNTIEIRVTAEDGTTVKIYTLSLYRPSAEALLSALAISEGTLAPTFDANTLNYTTSVASAVSSITVTATVEHAGATLQVQVNGGGWQPATSGSPSSSLSLNVGDNPIEIKVTAEDGATSNTYTLTAHRISANPDLSALVPSAGTLDPAFDASTTSYSLVVGSAVGTLTVTATSVSPFATIEAQVNSGGWQSCTSGSPSPALSLSVGDNTVMVRVTAEDGGQQKDYTLTVHRQSGNAYLSALTISAGALTPDFDTSTLNYSAPIVANSVSSTTVTVTVADSGATLQVQVNDGGWQGCTSGSPSSALSLDVGDNTVEVQVTAEDVAITKTYSVALERVGADVHIVPDDFTTIQAAIDATSDGNTVLVREGTYVENIVFPTDRNITVRSTHGPGSTTIDGDSNGSPVVTFPASVLTGVVLDGFTITNGHNTSTGGGGIRCNGASPTITDCSFLDNSAVLMIGIGSGGGMYNGGGSPTVINCTFEGNDAGGHGGGMYNGGGSPTVTNCTFSGNSAEWGGGMYNDNSSPTVRNCTFSGNTATNNRGGGMHNDNSSPTVRKSSFYNNKAGNQYHGSGMSNYNSSSPTVTNCLFYKNYAYSAGGQEMSNEGNSSPTVTNCTFLSTYQKAIYNANSSPIVTNCIVRGDIFDMIYDDPLTTSSSVVTYTNVPPGGFTGGTGNINADPMFVDEANGDLHLKPSSPCIDAGDNSAPALPATDIDGDDRKINDPTVTDTGNGTAPIVDMGADEFF